MSLLHTAPLLLIGVALALGLFLAEELGHRCHAMFGRKGGDKIDGDGAGHLLGAALALLGLLIAFTFSMAASRYDARRSLVVDEANALSTTYLRIQTLDEPLKGRLSALVLDYGEVRRAFFAVGDDAARLAAVDQKTDALQARIWADTVAAVRAAPAATVNPALLQTVNETFDLATSRRAALDARVPAAILRSLVIYALVAAGMLGYVLAANGRRHVVASTALFVLIAVAITLILDLDRSRSGTVTVSQAPLTRTLDSLRSLEAAKTHVGASAVPETP